MKKGNVFIFAVFSFLLLSLPISDSFAIGGSDTASSPLINPEPGIRAHISSYALAMNTLFRDVDSPIDCGTPLILAMLDKTSFDDPSLLTALQFLLRKPSFRDESTYRTIEGNFIIHYTKDTRTIDAVPLSDNDGNGIPDYVEVIGQGFEQARTLYVDILGFQNPVERFSPGQPYEVFIVNLGGSAMGAAVPMLSGSPSRGERAASFIIIDNMIYDDDSILKASAVHQYAHAITLAYSCKKEPWWTEATAIWLEDRLCHTLPKYLESINYRLAWKGIGLNAENLKIAQGNALWAFFLGEKDVSLIRKIWEDIGLFPEKSLLENFSQVLEREGYGSLQHNFSDYSIWNYFTGSSNDGNHFLFADILSDPVFEASCSSYPAPLTQVDNLVEPLGTSFIKFESEKSRGALIVNFEGDQGCQWNVDMLLVSDFPPFYLKSKMVVNESGHGSIGIPWQRISEVVMIVRNLDCERSTSGRYGFSAFYDPSYPFELRFFTATEENGSIAVQWETESEANLYGWNVYRSTEPEQNFSRINEIIIPALGDSSNQIVYTFIDNSTLRSVRYYYYIEGITLEGLPSRSHVSSANREE